MQNKETCFSITVRLKLFWPGSYFDSSVIIIIVGRRRRIPSVIIIASVVRICPIVFIYVRISGIRIVRLLLFGRTPLIYRIGWYILNHARSIVVVIRRIVIVVIIVDRLIGIIVKPTRPRRVNYILPVVSILTSIIGISIDINNT